MTNDEQVKPPIPWAHLTITPYRNAYVTHTTFNDCVALRDKLASGELVIVQARSAPADGETKLLDVPYNPAMEKMFDDRADFFAAQNSVADLLFLHPDLAQVRKRLSCDDLRAIAKVIDTRPPSAQKEK